MRAIGLLPAFRGTAVHDALGAYFQYDCQHGLCNAHLLRDLTAVSETTSQRWPQCLAELLLKDKTAVQCARDRSQTQLTPQRCHDFPQHYQHLVA